MTTRLKSLWNVRQVGILTGFSADKIMQMIQKLFIYTGIKIKKEYWDSYDQMNEVLLSKI